MDFSARRAVFRKLHESACFVIPNPWDVGTARYLRGLSFKALATTSAGYAFSRACRMRTGLFRSIWRWNISRILSRPRSCR